MSNEKTNQTLDVNDALAQSEAFVIKYKKQIITAVVAVVVVVGGFFAYIYGYSKPREDKAQELLGKWDFAGAFRYYSAALEWHPKDFDAACGVMTSGILKLNDVENWAQRLSDCTALIRSQQDWNMAQKSLEYSLDILKRFLSKGGRFVSPV